MKVVNVKLLILVLALFMPMLRSGGSVYSLSAEQRNLYRSGVNWYDINGAYCDSIDLATTSGNSQNTLPNNIPEPLKTIFEEAAKEYGADVVIMAALYSSENALWQNDDYLKDDWRIDKVHANNWSASSSAAKGPFQFIPNTWSAYEQEGPFIYRDGHWTTEKGPGDGINIDHIDDAAYAAAEFVVDLGGKVGIPLGSADDELPKTNQPKTVANVFKSYSKGGSIWRKDGVWLKSDGTPLPSINQTGLTSYITKSLEVYQALGGGGAMRAECVIAGLASGPVDYSANPNVRVEEATRCLSGPLQPGLAALRDYILQNWSPPVSAIGNRAVCRDVVGGTAMSIHSEGRAIDIFLDANDSEDLAMGNYIRDWLISNAEALGCQRVIWNKFSWSANSDGWNDYCEGDCPPKNPHTNHIHAELNWDGALMKTSFFSGYGL